MTTSHSNDELAVALKTKQLYNMVEIIIILILTMFFCFVRHYFSPQGILVVFSSLSTPPLSYFFLHLFESSKSEAAA